MISSIYFQSLSLVYIILLTIIYFSKKHLKTIENKLFIYLSISNIIGLILDIGSIFTIINMEKMPFINLIVTKAYLIYLLSWITLLTVYIYVISFKHVNNDDIFKKKFKKALTLFIMIFAFSCIMIFILPLSYMYDGDIIYSYGLSSMYLYAISGIYMIFWIICMIMNFKNIKSKKYLPMFAYMTIGLITIAIQVLKPNILLMTSMETFIVILMYFTIENPDTKMIEELNENRRLIEKTNEDKSNFLFRMAQEVRQPIDDIIRANDIMKQTDDKNLINKGIKYIDYSAKELKSIINNVLGVTSIDTYNIKMTSNTYDIKNLFAELISKYSSMVDKNVEFRANVNKNIPITLYGDGVKLKQVIATILENAIKYTKEGFIDFNVDAIVKNNICRLIISVEDSGIGMSIDKVNELLGLDQELTSEDVKMLEQVNLNLNIATKVIKLLGGHIIIRSEERKGSEFIIVVEQRIQETQLSKQKIKIEQYSNILSKNKRILLVDDSKEFIELITKELKKYNVEIATTMYGEDCVEKIKNNQKYDLILLDDNMDPDSGLATLKELQKINKFKTPVVVMLEKNKETIKEHYLDDGFKDYLLKYELETDTKRIAKKYL